MRMFPLRGLLLGASALALLLSPLVTPEARAGVGVTSATDGDPLGKPPTEAERVLRIGIDVQANEIITTSANDRAHLVFLDGSSLTIGPNARLTIDRFVFDPNTKTGELTINASKGVLRLVGGKISKNSPIRIDTPSGTIGIRGGITILDVGQDRTQSTFVFGRDMTVTAGGQTQTATRPGSMIVALLGGVPGLPQILAKGAMAGLLAALEGRPQPGSGGGGPGGRSPDQLAQTSGFSQTNSNQPLRIVTPGGDSFGSGPGPRNRNPNDTIVTAISNTNPAVDPLNQPGSIVRQNPVSEVNQQASTATYSGAMLGLVNNRSVAVGSYQNTWNFGTRSGVATITFDSATFQAPTVANGNSPTFRTQGPVASQNTNRSITLNGAFIGANNAYQVGTFNINGNEYNARGLFAAQKQ